MNVFINKYIKDNAVKSANPSYLVNEAVREKNSNANASKIVHLPVKAPGVVTSDDVNACLPMCS